MQHEVLCRKIIVHGWDVAVHVPGWVWLGLASEGQLRELGVLSLEKKTFRGDLLTLTTP